MWVVKSILNQVDWSEVALNVVEKEKPTIYWDAFEKLIQNHIEKIIKQEEYREDKSSNQGKREKEDTLKIEYMKLLDTDSKNDNSDDKIRDGSKSFDDRFFMIINEKNEYESDGYENDDEEDEDKEDENDEDQKDEDKNEDYKNELSV